MPQPYAGALGTVGATLVEVGLVVAEQAAEEAALFSSGVRDARLQGLDDFALGRGGHAEHGVQLAGAMRQKLRIPGGAIDQVDNVAHYHPPLLLKPPLRGRPRDLAQVAGKGCDGHHSPSVSPTSLPA